ncbi:MAG TPA: leucine-rich repeat domain-containing protein, partial [Chryseolinea sp.]|nr:leucine-rich repeat domain-containing protein [Chryseolinea sp.]
MKRFSIWIISFILLSLISFAVDAQKKKPVKKPAQKTQTQKKAPVVQKKTETKTTPATRTVSASEDEKRVKDIIAFLTYMLNTLGSSATSARDKEVLVKESYSKIFRDDKVQVEDDLIENRIVITNKDIVPYLKDVDFFFNEVKFEFAIEDIKSNTLANGDVFYKVSTRRTLTGTTTEGKAITNTIPRYIEINYDPAHQDLRIVSLYTHEINVNMVLTNWWKGLSLEWKSILIKKLENRNVTDSLNISEIKMITSSEDLDLSKNVLIQNLDPLDRLHNLKFLLLSGTNITDLTPLRNLAELETLDLSNTKIEDLSPLKYCSKMISLNIRNTPVKDISILEKMPGLKNLYMNGTQVNDFSPLRLLSELQKVELAYTRISNLDPFENLTSLSSIDVSGTGIQDLNPLKNLKGLVTLDIDSTHVSSIEPLGNLENLEVLHANYTKIGDLLPIQKLPRLQTIYADHTLIELAAVDKFHVVNPKVRIIYDSDNLNNWWNGLSPEWQSVFSKAIKASPKPSKEELANISNIDSIDVSGIMSINNLEPLRKLLKLEVIKASKTSIKDLAPLKNHKEIRYLDISETEVNDVSIITGFSKLKVLRADKSKIENVESITIPPLEFFYADQTAVHDIIAKEFLEKNPKCLLVYKTIHINRWWSALPENWKNVFVAQMNKDITRESFHKLVEAEAFQFKDAQVNDLNAFSEFVRLKELHFSGTAISTIPRLDNFQSLTSLHATNSPIQKIEAPGLPASLLDLDISNTPIEDLKMIGVLPELKKLNCAGTQIKRLDHLEKS